jgi:putative tricarboxylic transport membrane protein
MRLRVRNQQDFCSGLLFLAIALLALWVARDYPLGTAVRMSSGYLPRMLCLLLAALGLYVLVRSLVLDGPAISAIKPRPLAMITLGVTVFALSIQTLGIVLATFLLSLIGGHASPNVRLWEMIAAAIVLSLISVAIFIWGLGLALPLWTDL